MTPSHREPMHPGRLVAETLVGRGMTQAQLAKEIGMSLQTVSTLINGKRGVTALLALRLARVFRTTPEMWMELQTQLDLYRARRTERA